MSFRHRFLRVLGFTVVALSVAGPVHAADAAIAADVPTAPLQVLTAHAEGASALAFSPDGRWLASGGADKTVRVWNTGRWFRAQTLTGHYGAIKALAFSPDGRWLASGGTDKEIFIWDASTWRLAARLEYHKDTVHALRFSPNGTILASAGGDGRVVAWELVKGGWKKRGILKRHRGDVFGLAFSPDGRYCVTGGRDGSLRVNDPREWEELRVISRQPDSIQTVDFEGERLVASAGTDKAVRLWDAGGRRLITLSGHEETVHSCVFLGGSGLLASAGSDATARVWDQDTGLEMNRLSGHSGPVLALAFHASNGWLASAGSDGTVRVWRPLAVYARALQTLVRTDSGGRAGALPPRAQVEITATKGGAYRIRHDDRLQGWVTKDEMAFRRPKSAQPVTHLLLQVRREQDLYLKGVVYADAPLIEVSMDGRPLVRAGFEHERGNFSDSFPFEELVAVSTAPVVLTARDADGGRMEERLDLQAEPVTP